MESETILQGLGFLGLVVGTRIGLERLGLRMLPDRAIVGNERIELALRAEKERAAEGAEVLTDLPANGERTV